MGYNRIVAQLLLTLILLTFFSLLLSLLPACVLVGHPSSCSEGQPASPKHLATPPPPGWGKQQGWPTYLPSLWRGHLVVNVTCNTSPLPPPACSHSPGVEGQATWLAGSCYINPPYMSIPWPTSLLPPPQRLMADRPGWLGSQHNTTKSLHLPFLPTPHQHAPFLGQCCQSWAED